ncbi:DUF1631 family protein [Caenimonas aquaedulcis]|uniref:DUF1631 domain-containing protein n=1 Tax=Caenimonas aquaedulcis TaxID=2793270 RepID=A0A931H5C7_9BURK|nr:DUF1631 family protein [Caenimonas aquaedulcis]MBG9388843.1 DUF1631 domain-containing protein [Caenimonas aquaedulcis]
MSVPRPPHESGARLARLAREQFVTRAQQAIPPMVQAMRSKLSDLVDSSSSSREMHERRDAMMEFDRKGPQWAQAVVKAWQQAVVPPTATARIRLEAGALQLLGEDVVEQKIISGRLALMIGEKTTWEMNDLKVRMQFLDGEEMSTADILRPEALSQLVVEQWGAAELSNECWTLVQDVVQKHLVEHVPAAYKATNEFLIAQGVMRNIDLTKRVRRGASGPAAKRPPRPGEAQDSQPPQGAGNDTGGGYGDWGGGGGYAGGGQDGGYASGPQGGGYAGGAQGGPAGGGYAGGAQGGGYAGGSQGGGYAGGSQGGGYAGGPQGGGYAGGSQGGGYAPGGQGGPVGPGGQRSGGYSPGAEGPHGGGAGATGGGSPGGARQGDGPADTGSTRGGPASRQGGSETRSGVSEETRMMTSSPPLARARARASGVLGQLRRLLTDRVAGFDSSPHTPSPALAEAISHQITQVQSTEVQGAPGGSASDEIVVYDDVAVQQVAVDLRKRSGELKKKAATSNEKATIEIVALMFQSILSEERIPPAIRVWFARLQMPVLRVAISEPEFFGSLEHPARQLIDRMGSCVMGFDSAAIGGSALEIEIKRVVQVIEQYPETGRRVFQLVYEEFQKFLGKFLTEAAPTQRLVSVAQQVEQKETLAIQYTIEMRSMLADMPVREEIREFLFKVWAEVLAVSAVKSGPQNEETLSLKRCASELVWAASAKPNRGERAKVIQDLPKLLQRLRQGMSLVNIQGKEQEAHIKAIGDTLADAFLSKTEAIPHDRIEEMSKRLANLEDFITGDPETDLPLDAESIEMMLGIDASNIEVVADGGSRPNAAMLAWAAELQLGNWFSLDHNGATTQVQYVWRSDRKQLHLFASPGGRSYLVQARRLAAYLQAGLLLPAEEEALTVRATRDALAKLDANPERLLQ